MSWQRTKENLTNIPIHWVNILRVRDAVFSQALMVLSLSSLMLSNFPGVLGLIGATPLTITVFVGSILFLLGHIFSGVYTPKEFYKSTSIDEAVERISRVDSYLLFASRRDMLDSLITRFMENKPPDLNDALIQYASRQLKNAQDYGQTEWREHSRGLYHADLTLRQYEDYQIRLKSVGLLVGGGLLMLSATLIRIAGALADVLLKLFG